MRRLGFHVTKEAPDVAPSTAVPTGLALGFVFDDEPLLHHRDIHVHSPEAVESVVDPHELLQLGELAVQCAQSRDVLVDGHLSAGVRCDGRRIL